MYKVIHFTLKDAACCCFCHVRPVFCQIPKTEMHARRYKSYCSLYGVLVISLEHFFQSYIAYAFQFINHIIAERRSNTRGRSGVGVIFIHVYVGKRRLSIDNARNCVCGVLHQPMNSKLNRRI